MDGQSKAAAGRRMSLVLPAFNEEAGVRQAVVEADDALAALTDDYEILVVDDGSRDATAAVVAELTAERPRAACCGTQRIGAMGRRCERASRRRGSIWSPSLTRIASFTSPT